MNPIQVNCPGCQKRFLVRPEDLGVGLARFQCSSCQTFFAFNWPQPPGTVSVRATAMDPKDFKTIEPSMDGAATASAPAATAAMAGSSAVSTRATRECINCHEKVDIKYQECPKCGVIFDKVKKIRPPEPVVQPAGPEVVAAWEAAKINYADMNRHETFIQLCLSRDNLAFASSQYRAVLLVNPSDEIANRMQNRIVELATAAYIATATSRGDRKSQKKGVSSVILSMGGFLTVAGFSIPQARSLVAVGISIMVFVLIFRFLNRFRDHAL